MMTSELDREALFSLELAVDRLVLAKNISCRFPAIAFRLLDFPTLLVHHVDPPFADMLRAKLLADQHATIPAQLVQMLDKNGGGFLIRRGKSCLFRMSPNAMRSHLLMAPLYIMVVDTFPEVPKLVASCTVPLAKCMGALYDEICAYGVSVPTTSGENCEVDIANLMGEKLGTLSVGLRLLSLGSAMLAHIPDKGVSTAEAPGKPAQLTDGNFGPVIDDSAVSRAVAVASVSAEPERDFDVEVPVIVGRQTASRCTVDGQTQMERGNLETVATQTSKRNARNGRMKFQPETATQDDTVDDIVQTNVVCPPPLFYHSHKSAGSRLTWHYRHYQQDWAVTWQNKEINNGGDDDGWSDDGTIRQIDKCTDSDDELPPHDSRFQAERSTSVNHPETRVNSRNRINVKTDPTSKPDVADLTKFPILNALLAEILRMQGVNLVPVQDQVVDENRYVVKHRKTTIKQRPSFARPATAGHERVGHKCFDVSAPIPKDISWLGNRSKTNVQSSSSASLVPGMTNTQRLRLSKSNPRLLQQLEVREAQRRSEVMATLASKQKKGVRNNANRLVVDAQKDSANDVQGKVAASKYGIIDEIGSIDVYDDRLGDSYDSRDNTARHKRPVPTPRTSKMNNKENNHPFADSPPATSRFDGSKTYNVVPRRPERSMSLRSSSEEKIQLTMPAFDDSEDVEAATNIRGRRPRDGGRVDAAVMDRRAPGSVRSSDLGAARVSSAPPAAPKSTPRTEPPAAVETTENPVVLSVEDLGLKKFVEHFPGDSDDDDESHHTDEDENEEEDDDDEDSYVDAEAAGEEPDLKKIVDRYSDDSAMSENGLSGLEPQLRKIVDHQSDSDDGLQQSRENSLTRSYITGESGDDGGAASSGRSSASPSNVQAAVRLPSASSSILAGKDGRSVALSRQPLRLPKVLSPRRTVKNGAIGRQLEMEVDQSTSLGVESYSEIFEEPSDDDLKDMRSARDAKPVAEAKLGYTWT